MERGNRILVVDDERTVCESVRKVLTRQGLRVDRAYSVEEGLRKFEDRGDYAAVIIDLVMPKAGGEELLKVVKGRRPETSVVIMTGYASIESAVRTTKLGAFDYLTKPFTSDELREVAARAIQRHNEAQTAAPTRMKQSKNGTMDVDLPFDAEELEAHTSKQFAETVTHTDIPVGNRALPKDYCVKGRMICKLYERQAAPCQNECPILMRAKRTELSAEPRSGAAATDAIDIDLPFSAKEIEKYTSSGYVACLGRFGMPMVSKWDQADEDVLKRVLVVDDEPVVCNSIRKILFRQGYHVDGTSDGGEALQQIQENDYELVILDMVMPKMNGLEVLKEIKSRRPETNVVMVTGYASIDTAKEAIHLGAADYLPKPFTPEELVRAASEAMAA